MALPVTLMLCIQAGFAQSDPGELDWEVSSGTAVDTAQMDGGYGDAELKGMALGTLAGFAGYALAVEKLGLQAKPRQRAGLFLGAELWAAQWNQQLGYPAGNAESKGALGVESDVGLTPFVGLSAAGIASRVRGQLNFLFGLAQGSGDARATTRRLLTGLARIEARLSPYWWVHVGTSAGWRKATISTLDWAPSSDPSESLGFVSDDNMEASVSIRHAESLLVRERFNFTGWTESFVGGLGYRYTSLRTPLLTTEPGDSSSYPSAVETDAGAFDYHSGVLFVGTRSPEILQSTMSNPEVVPVVPYGTARFAVGGGTSRDPSRGSGATSLLASGELDAGLAGRVDRLTWRAGYRTAVLTTSDFDLGGGRSMSLADHVLKGVVMSASWEL